MVSACHVVIFASLALLRSTEAQVVDFREQMLKEINKVRKEKSLDDLCINDKVMDAAQIQANDMAENNFVNSKGSDGSSPKSRAEVQGFIADTVTETVAVGYPTTQAVVAAWAKSATAGNTLLSGDVTVVGAGYAFDMTKKFVHFWAVDYSVGECGDGAATNGTTTSDASTPASSEEESEVEDGSDERTITTAGTPSTNGGAATPTANPSTSNGGAGTPPGSTPNAAPASSGDGTPIPADDDEPPPATPEIPPAPATENLLSAPPAEESLLATPVSA
ncbi:putative CAP domain-containing protein [Plasmopara halstedii]